MGPMVEAPDPRLFPYADHVLDRLEADREHGRAVRDAVAEGARLMLSFHPHSDGSGWCAEVQAVPETGAPRGLVHLRGLVKTRPECAPMARVLAGLITARYRLVDAPRILLDGAALYV